MLPRTAALVLFFLVASGSAVRSEVKSTAPLKIGDRVRVVYKTNVTERILLVLPIRYTATKEVVGKLVSCSADSITIGFGPKSDKERQLGTRDVKRVYVACGEKRNTVQGLLGGAGIGSGFALFAVLAVPHKSGYDSSGEFYRRSRVSFGGVAAVIAGTALVGGIIGWMWKSEAWCEVPSSGWKIRATADPARGTLGASLVLSF